jgi:GNAT superfamily N-acetyltransferase
MKVIELNIVSTPALLIGEKREKVFMFVHGLHGRKEEALAFAEVAVPKGYQVLGIDLPVERKPWEVLPLLNEVRDFLYEKWKYVSVRANSIGSWFTLLAFQSKKVEQALLVSPILDMKRFIELMPQCEDDYYEWVVNNPIICWYAPTYILRPEIDLIVNEEVGREFISLHQCQITIMADGEHWFHTPEQLAFLKTWEMSVLNDYQYVTLRDRPELKDMAATWFHSKWNVPKEAYLECMDAYLSGETEYGWYLCLDGSRIIGGMGVIENDFHDRKDLSPNVCAVYTEEEYRCQGIAGKLLNMVVEDMRSKGIAPLYLVTNHTGLYERYGWEFLCMVQGDGEPEMSRMYIHK